mgnify:CR=1 FL=1
MKRRRNNEKVQEIIDRDIRENIVRKYNPFYHRGSYFDKEYYDVPGFTVKFSHSIIGDIDLLSYHASTYLMWHPDNLNISKNTQEFKEYVLGLYN